MDEKWLHHFTPESNRQSAEGTARDEPPPKCGKTQKSAGKRLLRSIFGAFKRRNRGKAASFEEKKVLFHQDNAPCHKSMEIDDKIA
ncbi:hypothetical protein TNCV_4592711 [Trichonephila clavipes]|nr:hypothetical protein TNCV_4592711 [Trichonephila clavipes]